MNTPLHLKILGGVLGMSLIAPTALAAKNVGTAGPEEGLPVTPDPRFTSLKNVPQGAGTTAYGLSVAGPSPSVARNWNADFLAYLHHQTQNDIDQAKYVRSQSTNPEVQAYADKVIHDSRTLDDNVQQLAEDQHIDLERPRDGAGQAATKQHEQEMAALKGLQGADLDRAYLTMRATGRNDETQQLFLMRSRLTGRDASQLADRSLPVIESHRDNAVAILEGRAPQPTP